MLQIMTKSGTETAVKEFFPVDHVVAETLNIYQELLGLQFSELKNAHTWHPDVRCFQVNDVDNGELLGHFYLDLYPRDYKFNWAAVFPLISRNNNVIQSNFIFIF